MKTNTVLLGATFTALLASASIFTACHDDLEGDSRKYNDGKLHFQFLFDNKEGAWNEDGTPKQQTRLHQPLDVLLPEGMTQPLYLHCTELNDIETPDIAAVPDSAVTRGQRITGEAFDERGLLQNLGLYGTVGTVEALPATVIERNTLANNNDGWWTTDLELSFEAWPAGENGDFYGFAPVPGDDEGYAKCYNVDVDGTPTIYFEMLPDEADNKDILTAHTPDVSQGDKDANGIQLTFHHVLSAIKFKVEDASFMTYPVGITSPVNKYLKITDLTIQGIYKKGTAELGNEYTDANNDPQQRTSNWSYDTTEDNLGSCTINNINKTSAAEGDELINTDEHCLMVLPQVVPAGAKLIVTANLYDDNSLTTLYKEGITFEVELGGKNIEWKPGYSYTYKLSKDKAAYEYTLQSSYNSVNGGSITFESGGGSADIDVVSYVTRRIESTDKTAATDWHVEYMEEGGTWTPGLPMGFTMKNKETGEQVDNALAIPGSMTAVTYTITAPSRIDIVPQSVLTLRQKNYSSDGQPYDLSLYDINGNPITRTTANCYIIKGYGKFKLPLVYGNGQKRGLTNSSAFNEKIYDGTNEHHVFRDHKGNKITNEWMFGTGGQVSAYGPPTAEVLWSDAPNVINSVSISDDKDYLCFEILKEDVQPANILLAVKDKDGNIAWSWHIWVMADNITTTSLTYQLTDDENNPIDDYTMEIADRDLGWLAPEVTNYKTQRHFTFRVVQNEQMGKDVKHLTTQKAGAAVNGGSTILYQHGRKDPFPSKTVKISDEPNAVTYDSNGNIQSIKFDEVDLFDEMKCDSKSQADVKIEDAIKNPTVVYRNNGGWFGQLQTDGTTYEVNQRYPCWNPDLFISADHSNLGADMTNQNNFVVGHTKTIYDPSPEGFIVPNSGVLQMIKEDTPLSYHSTTQDTDGNTIDAPIPYITTNSGIPFYLAGGRYNIYGGTTQYFAMADFQKYGYWWTAGIVGNNYGAWAKLGDGNTSTATVEINPEARALAQAHSVRPIVDIWKEQVGRLVSRMGEANDVALSITSGTNTTKTTSTWGISNVTFTMNNGETRTLQWILDNYSSLQNVRVYIKDLYVGFSYSGGYGALGLGVGKNRRAFSITYTDTNNRSIAWNVPANTYNSWDIIQGGVGPADGMPTFIRFIRDGNSYWTRHGNNNTDLSSNGTFWSQLISLTTSDYVSITNVRADIRISYYEESI